MLKIKNLINNDRISTAGRPLVHNKCFYYYLRSPSKCVIIAV
jgi:hypothetical protein